MLDRRSLLPRAATLGLALAVTTVFFIQFCNLVFDCGCRALWAGKSAHCNIHSAVPPHCPWCLEGGSFGSWALGAILVVQVALAALPGRFGVFRSALVLLAFPLVGGVAAVLTGLATGYWQ